MQKKPELNPAFHMLIVILMTNKMSPSYQNKNPFIKPIAIVPWSFNALVSMSR